MRVNVSWCLRALGILPRLASGLAVAVVSNIATFTQKPTSVVRVACRHRGRRRWPHELPERPPSRLRCRPARRDRRMLRRPRREGLGPCGDIVVAPGSARRPRRCRGSRDGLARRRGLRPSRDERGAPSARSSAARSGRLAGLLISSRREALLLAGAPALEPAARWRACVHGEPARAGGRVARRSGRAPSFILPACDPPALARAHAQARVAEWPMRSSSRPSDPWLRGIRGGHPANAPSRSRS